MWLEEAAASGQLGPELLTEAGAPPREDTWVARNHDHLQPQLQVAPAEVDDLGRYFASYLQTTFVVEPNPADRLLSNSTCHCEVCTWVERGRFAQPARVTARDKREAAAMRVDFLEDLARELACAVPRGALEKLARAPELREALSLCAYTADLLCRMRGETAGAASLVLWRGFAWTKEGSPRKGFELEVDEILAAEETVVRAVRALQSH